MIIEYVTVVFAICLVIIIASIVVPWACKHDGECIIEALKKRKTNS